MSKFKTLNLCEKHQQEDNHSHFASSNCDFCKISSQVAALEKSNHNLGESCDKLCDAQVGFKSRIKELEEALESHRLLLQAEVNERDERIPVEWLRERADNSFYSAEARTINKLADAWEREKKGGEE